MVSNHRTLPLPARRPLVTALASLLVVFAFISTLTVVHAGSAPTFVTLANSVAPTGGAHVVGSHSTSAQMSVELVLQPKNSTQLDALLMALYNPKSSQYHHWLQTGEFNTLFALSASHIAQVNSFLQQAGLSVLPSSTPFLVRATGTTAQVEAAFHTHVSDYQTTDGQAFYQNSTVIQVPSSVSSLVLAVNGLSNTAVMHPHYITTRAAAQQAGQTVPYYGAGPGGQGLTPGQINGLYDANEVHQLGSRGEGKGVTLAVFELSAYTPADVNVYEQQFFGSSAHVPLVDVNVDGGPVTPQCPKGDQCGPFSTGTCANGCDSADYSGDVEVEADIEMQIALASKADRIFVYNAPNDVTGQTVTDEYFQIANDNKADSISSSWGSCEQDAGFAQAQAESVAFKQMATQGQSMFSAAGDTGAYDCLRGSGNTTLAVDDPSSQPYVTAVGGTSFSAFDPGVDTSPAYPTGFETVWNVLNRCKASALKNCSDLGAGGGGVSTFWGKPAYQQGPGVLSALSQKSPYCSQAQSTQYCRELPDVSANADEYTPYAEYCTGDPKTNSACGSFSSGLTPPGWFGIGGTSLSSPLWSGIIALWDSVHQERLGNANQALYNLFHSGSIYSQYFHDITGKNQTENNNGFYPTTPNYDMATGIGTPRISGIAESDLNW